MSGSVQLGRLFGIPFRLHFTWFLIFVLVTVILSYVYFPELTYNSWSTAAYWIVGVLTSLTFFASVLVHELSHSAVAIRAGLPVKSITLFFFGGVALMTREATKPATELRMALAGPFASIVLAGLFYLGFRVSIGFSEYVAVWCWWLAWINAVLALFNMIPGFPLDGGRVFRSIVWMVTKNYVRATRIATMGGRLVSYLFMVGGVVLLFLPDWRLNGLWLLLLGFLLGSAAAASYRQALLLDVLTGFTAGDVMARESPLIPPHLTVGELVQSSLLSTSSQSFLVVEGDRLTGLLTLPQIKKIPRKRWDVTTVGRAMTSVEQLEAVRPGDEALHVLNRMNEGELSAVTVAQDGRVVGVILRDNLMRFAENLRRLRLKR